MTRVHVTYLSVFSSEHQLSAAPHSTRLIYSSLRIVCNLSPILEQKTKSDARVAPVPPGAPRFSVYRRSCGSHTPIIRHRLDHLKLDHRTNNNTYYRWQHVNYVRYRNRKLHHTQIDDKQAGRHDRQTQRGNEKGSST
jgi:hypothetical protein